MSQFNAPVRRKGGELDVYTGLLAVATIVLLVGVWLLASANKEHSATDGASGGLLKLIDQPG